jgi:uncharacterized CHY-type Zn-finger protein
MLIHGLRVNGTNVDSQTRCAHYHTSIDIIALRFKCCGEWFPCFECHRENTNHTARVWGIEEFETKAVLCGNCGCRMTISEYMSADFVCPKCSSAFNPGCANHYHMYFETAPEN